MQDKIVQGDLNAVSTSLKFIKEIGFTVVRTWAFMEYNESNHDESNVMQKSNGKLLILLHNVVARFDWIMMPYLVLKHNNSSNYHPKCNPAQLVHSQSGSTPNQ